MKTITFVRHGQSTANAGGLTMDHDAIPLSPLGEQHAKTLASVLHNEPSAIFCSKYVRARQTSLPYAARVGMSVETHPLLHEFSTIDPVLLGGMYGEQRRPFVEAYWQQPDPHKRMGDAAETFAEFDQRVTSFMSEMQRIPDGAVLFGQGMWIALLFWKLLGFSSSDTLGMKAFRRFQLGLPMPNGAVYHVCESVPGLWYGYVDENIMRSILADRTT